MAVGLECRSPFLDHEFMELTAQIPSVLKQKYWIQKKYILKKALSSILPKSILNRPKMGFSIPIQTWFKSESQEYLENILLSRKTYLKEIINQEYIKSLITKHRQTGVNNSSRLWCLLTLELWFKEYFR